METLDKHFRELTRAAFARHGFAEGDLTGNWPEIVGVEVSRFCEPERIKWPRGDGANAQKSGGTLIIRAAAGRALDLQYGIPQIIERVNRFYGYGAIAAVRIVQSRSWAAEVLMQQADSSPAIPFPAEIAKIEDAGLRAALERLGTGVAKAAQGSPQGK